MTDQELSRLEEVFRVVFDLPPDMDPRHARQEGVPAWDSLGHVTLVSAMANEFGVEISVVDSLEVTSFEAAASLLGELLGEPAS